jgi:hypothetical protein
MDGSAGSHHWYSGAGDWLAKNFAVVLTLVGVVAYTGLHLAFVSFYRRFGVSPEDVGYDYASVLTTTLPGVGVLLAPVILFSALVLLGFGNRTPILRRRAFRIAYGVGLPIIVVVELALLLSIAAPNLAWRAERGHAVSGERFLGVQVLPWLVHPVTIVPATKDAKAQLGDLQKVCAMYLGAKDATYVLYDVIARGEVRVPVAAVSLRMGHFARGCDARVTERRKSS